VGKRKVRDAEKGETLPAEAPPLLRYIKWFRLHGLRNWGIVAIAVVVVLAVVTVKRFHCREDEQATKITPRLPASGETMRDLQVDPNTGRTDLYVRTKAKVDERMDFLLREKVLRWLFIGQPGSKDTLTLHDGRPYSYHGLEFSQSVREFFWSEQFIEPFLEDAIREVFDEVGKECQSNRRNPGAALKEAGWLLDGTVRRVYDEMADVDQRLRGKGFPKMVQREDVQFRIERMQRRVQEHLKAATTLYSDIRP
jgi:hypothetical protein